MELTLDAGFELGELVKLCRGLLYQLTYSQPTSQAEIAFRAYFDRIEAIAVNLTKLGNPDEDDLHSFWDLTMDSRYIRMDPRLLPPSKEAAHG